MKTTKFFILVSVATALSFNLTACDDDDDDNSSAKKEEITKEVTVNNAGSLKSVFSDKNVTTLKISGSLNGDDISYLREIGSDDIYSVTTLDLENANIVEGTATYTAYSVDDFEDFYTNSRVEIKSSTSGNEISTYMFGGYCAQNKTSDSGQELYNGIKFEKIILPNSVTTIDDYAFAGCHSLEEITFGENVTSIGLNITKSCESLFKITCTATTPPTISETAFPDKIAELSVPEDAVSNYEGSSWAKCFDVISEIK